MNTQSRIHIQALTDVFELVLLSSVLALVSDTAWMLHDILTNGISITYIILLTGLSTATIITAWAWIKHHKNSYIKLLHDLLVTKLKKQKQINHHKREHKG